MWSMIRWDNIIIEKYKISVLKRKIIREDRGREMPEKDIRKRFRIKKESSIRRG